MKSQFDNYSIIGGIVINLLIVYVVLRATGWLSKKMSAQVLATLRKVFGIVLVAIAIQMAKDHF